MLDDDLKNTHIRLPAYYAVIDAAAQNRKYWDTFSAKQQTLAENIERQCIEVFTRSQGRIYLTARKKFIAVKVELPSYLDKHENYQAYQDLLSKAVNENIDVRQTKISLIFRIPK